MIPIMRASHPKWGLSLTHNICCFWNKVGKILWIQISLPLTIYDTFFYEFIMFDTRSGWNPLTPWSMVDCLKSTCMYMMIAHCTVYLTAPRDQEQGPHIVLSSLRRQQTLHVHVVHNAWSTRTGSCLKNCLCFEILV